MSYALGSDLWERNFKSLLIPETGLTIEEGIVEVDGVHMVTLVVQNQTRHSMPTHGEDTWTATDTEVIPEGCPEVSVNMITPPTKAIKEHVQTLWEMLHLQESQLCCQSH